MNNLPDKENNVDGLYNKYTLYKNDNTDVDPKAEYFVLRVDDAEANDSIETRAHREACRRAVLKYAEEIASVLPKLADDLVKRYS